MGKKKSKTAREKNSKAARTSKKFGVAARKGGGREKSSFTTSTTMLMSAVNSAGNSKSRTTTTSSSTTTTATSHSKLQNKSVKRVKPTSQKNGSALDNDFDRQMHSMWEREAAEWKKLKQFKSRKSGTCGRQERQQRHSFQFTQPTFVVDDKDKSTDQLMNEAARQVGTMSGITEDQLRKVGQNQQSSSLQAAMSKQRIASYWKLSPESESGALSRQRNAFGALDAVDDDEDDDDDDDNNDRIKRRAPPAPLFNFAPASFTVRNGPSISSQATATSTTSLTHEAEFDPDL